MKTIQQFREAKSAVKISDQQTESAETAGENIEENLKRKQDAMRVVHGAMTRDEFRRKWGSKKPKNKLAGPGGVYKNLVRSEGVQNEAGLEDACWKGYEAIGMKMKNGRKVPNCVPKEGHAEDAQTAHQAAHAALKQGDTDTYHKEMDKKFASHQAAAAEAGKKPVKTFEAADDEKNLKITKHSRLAVEAEKRGDKAAQQYHLDIVSRMKNESVNEATEPKAQKHLVTVTVTDPQHPATSKRKEKIMKRVRVSAKDPKDAVTKAEAHYKKHGFKVHDSLHHSVVQESLDTDEFIDQYDPNSNENDSCEAKEDPKKGMSEASEEPQETGLSAEDKATIDRVKTLIRFGLLDMTDMNVAVRVMKKIELDQPITSTQERQILTELLQKLIGIVTGDETLFRKVRLAVSQQ